MWDPRRLTTLWASTACYRDGFTFLPTFERNIQAGNQGRLNRRGFSEYVAEPASAGFLLTLLFDPEDGGDMSRGNFGLGTT
jgi:hypothetical protein